MAVQDAEVRLSDLTDAQLAALDDLHRERQQDDLGERHFGSCWCCCWACEEDEGLAADLARIAGPR